MYDFLDFFYPYNWLLSSITTATIVAGSVFIVRYYLSVFSAQACARIQSELSNANGRVRHIRTLEKSRESHTANMQLYLQTWCARHFEQGSTIKFSSYRLRAWVYAWCAVIPAIGWIGWGADTFNDIEIERGNVPFWQRMFTVHCAVVVGFIFLKLGQNQQAAQNWYEISFGNLFPRSRVLSYIAGLPILTIFGVLFLACLLGVIFAADPDGNIMPYTPLPALLLATGMLSLFPIYGWFFGVLFFIAPDGTDHLSTIVILGFLLPFFAEISTVIAARATKRNMRRYALNPPAQIMASATRLFVLTTTLILAQWLAVALSLELRNLYKIQPDVFDLWGFLRSFASGDFRDAYILILGSVPTVVPVSAYVFAHFYGRFVYKNSDRDRSRSMLLMAHTSSPDNIAISKTIHRTYVSAMVNASIYTLGILVLYFGLLTTIFMIGVSFL